MEKKKKAKEQPKGILGNWIVRNLLLADYRPNPEDDIPYEYSIQEIGYNDADGDHWNVNDVRVGYSMSEQGGTTAKTKDAESGKIKPGTTAAAPSTITIHNETPTEMSFTKEWRKNGFPLAWQEPITVTLNAYADNPDEDVTEDASYTLSPESHEG